MVQADVHAAYGGVVPNLAMEAHKAAMDSCVEDALQQAGVTAQDLSAVAVSVGPGLSLCLQVCPCVHLAGLATGGSCDGGDFHASHIAQSVQCSQHNALWSLSCKAKDLGG